MNTNVLASQAASRWPVPGLPRWSLAMPLLAMLTLALTWGMPLGLGMVLAAALFLTVVCAIHHAEVVAHRVGEPYGTLVLAVAVTIIEVALIVALMLAGGESANTLARDTVFSAVMIVCAGVVGLCLVIGGLRHGVLAFRVEGTSPALASLAALACLALVLPSLTTTSGPTYSGSQLAFAGVTSLALYGVFVQTVRHRDYFLPMGSDDEDIHAAPPTNWIAWGALVLLMVSLVSVVGLAKALAPALEAGVAAAGAPKTVSGVLIALIMLLPKIGAALRATRSNRMQSSLNLALGLRPVDIVLLMLTLVVGTLTLGSGRATVMQGAMHLVLFAAFLFLTVVP